MRRSKAQTRRKAIRRATKRADIAERRARGEIIPRQSLQFIKDPQGSQMRFLPASDWTPKFRFPKTPEQIEEEERLKLREQLMRQQS